MKVENCDEAGCPDGAIRKCSKCGKKLCLIHLNFAMYQVEGGVVECDTCLAAREQAEDNRKDMT